MPITFLVPSNKNTLLKSTIVLAKIWVRISSIISTVHNLQYHPFNESWTIADTALWKIAICKILHQQKHYIISSKIWTIAANILLSKLKVSDTCHTTPLTERFLNFVTRTSLAQNQLCLKTDKKSIFGYKHRFPES